MPLPALLLLILGAGVLIVVGVLTLRRRSRQSEVVTVSPESLDPLVDGLAAQMARGEEPRFREVEQGGRRVPYRRTGPMGMGLGGGSAAAVPAGSARWWAAPRQA